ncbi:putative succinyl-diaminopimelate desuccinylase [Streptomyces sp. YIM 130001]|uniref:M20/M25/M40 family metallo-hydrolase n=1 Tax=Streptomyces sp. YIM 130001 TaxID=2259644 RepID=UPI000E64C167|nr:M20/M25/M40 family metallo-hydrolase [Streptomyces sp. YIM 130001]RII13388.1 putative succinyl-diaminopimelate desuccinylase [Streptomyces sp. YIM 130001]
MSADPTRVEETRTLRGLVEIPSPSGSEAAAGAFLAARMTALGYDVRTDAVGNVIGEIGDPTGPVIMMVGHLDTVAGTLPVHESGGLLFGRGTVDAKGPLATMVHAGARAASSGCGRIVVIGAVEEEAASRGAHHLTTTLAPPDALLIGEPSGAGTLVVGYRGVLRFCYEVRRPPAHTSSPAERAVELASDLWQQVRTLLPPAPVDAPLFDHASPALVGLDGGLTHARAEISCRIPRGFDTTGFLDEVRKHAADGEITVVEQVPAVRTGRGAPLVRAFAGAVRRSTGAVAVKVKLGTSDMNVLAPHWSAPALAYGPGDSKLDHTDEEHIRLEEYLLAIDILAEALPDIASSLARPVRAAGPYPEERRT